MYFKNLISLRHKAGVTLAILCLAWHGLDAHAISDQAATEQVRAQLIASVDAVHPGQQIVLGVQQRIVPHWHTYWINPGDSGLATKIAWELAPGAIAGEIQWPLPSRFTLGPVTNYGYADEVTLLSTVTVQKDAKVGSSFPIKAKVNWLVCQEVCIPQEVELALSLPVVAVAPAAAQATQSSNPVIEKARAALPVASPWPIRAIVDQDGLSLFIDGAKLQTAKLKEIWFYPDQWGAVAHGAAQPLKIDGDNAVLKLTPGEAAPAAGVALSGVLVLTEERGGLPVTRGYTINPVIVKTSSASSAAPAAVPVVAPVPPPNRIRIPNAEANITFASALLLALLGGLILNLMPCVFPILSIKALSLLNHVHQTPAQARLHGVVYTAGVLASFTLLGVVLIVFKAAGAQVGWGFQFQSPLFVLAVAYLMFAVGLNLSGVFTFGTSVAGIGSSLAERGGYSGSFFTGVLATIVATPCTAPFMGGALAYALTQPPLALLAVFLSLGLGLALPYLLLSTWPLLQRGLPRPGRWMERLKQLLAFPMYAAAVWLVWVLAQQAGVNAIAIALGGMVVIAFAAWLYETSRSGSAVARRTSAVVAVVALMVALVSAYLGIAANPMSSGKPVEAQAKNWAPYSAERLQALRAKGEPVFVNFTAAWCITCLVNEQVALSQSEVTEAFQQAGITYLKGDWTNQDPQISKQLAEFGRSGVPLYVFYPKGVDVKPTVLPQILTPQIVLNALKLPPVAAASPF
ncbi:MAG: protein-disulfide reductase DsbD domain-containing protein [Pseudomonadota bacterium]